MEQRLRAPGLAQGTWKIVEWQVDVGERFSDGDTLVRLMSSDGRAGTIRATSDGYVRQLDYVRGDSIAGNATVGRFETETPPLVSSTTLTAVITLVVLLLVIVFARHVIADVASGTWNATIGQLGGDDDGDKSATASTTPTPKGTPTATPTVTPPTSAAEVAAEQRVQRCTRGTRMMYQSISLSEDGIGAYATASGFDASIRGRVASRLEVVACPVNKGGRPLRRAFRRGDRVIVAWILAKDADPATSDASLCLSTEIRGGRYYRALELSRGIGAVASTGDGGANDHFYRIPYEWPDDHWVGGRFEVKLSRSVRQPAIGVFAVRCKSHGSHFPRTYGDNVKAST